MPRTKITKLPSDQDAVKAFWNKRVETNQKPTPILNGQATWKPGDKETSIVELDSHALPLRSF